MLTHDYSKQSHKNNLGQLFSKSVKDIGYGDRLGRCGVLLLETFLMCDVVLHTLSETLAKDVK